MGMPRRFANGAASTLEANSPRAKQHLVLQYRPSGHSPRRLRGQERCFLRRCRARRAHWAIDEVVRPAGMVPPQARYPDARRQLNQFSAGLTTFGLTDHATSRHLCSGSLPPSHAQSVNRRELFGNGQLARLCVSSARSSLNFPASCSVLPSAGRCSGRFSEAPGKPVNPTTSYAEN
jgi:hypothetical protein